MYNGHHIVLEILGIYKMDAGCTCPIRVKLDNDIRAVLKYPRNPQGMIVLLNEFITGHLASSISITCPNFGIATIDNNVAVGGEMPCNTNSSIYSGLGFYSEYIPKTIPASSRTLKHAVNLHETSRIVLLDHIIKNSDRHEGNLLLTANSQSPMIYAIDHTHAFGDPDWNITSLSLNDAESPYVWRENESVYNMLIGAGAPFTPEQLNTECQFIQNRITEESLSGIFASIPTEWVEAVGQENISHLRKYIMNRVHNLERICNVIIQERGD